MRRLRTIALAAGLGLATLIALSFAGPLGGRAGAQTPPARLSSPLPAWVAPGATVTVSGFAQASEKHLRLETAGGEVLARTISGRLGRFQFRFAAPEPGDHRLRLVWATGRVPLGTLLVRPLRLAAVGDITFGEQVGPAVALYGGRYPWTGVAGSLRTADITVGNLETSIGRGGVPADKEYTFRGPPEALPAMAAFAGFDVLSLANNHSLDFGRETLLETIRSVRAAGMQPIGAGVDDRLARRPAIVGAGGLRVAILGYSDVNPPGFAASAAAPGTARADWQAIAADVHAARRRADVVVCFFHWGIEGQAHPDARQQGWAQACLGAGARVVLGAHPHVLGPVARPSGSTLVAWSLGNFVFPSTGEAARTAILDLRLGAGGVRGYRLLPVEIRGFRPQLREPVP